MRSGGNAPAAAELPAARRVPRGRRGVAGGELRVTRARVARANGVPGGAIPAAAAVEPEVDPAVVRRANLRAARIARLANYRANPRPAKVPKGYPGLSYYEMTHNPKND